MKFSLKRKQFFRRIWIFFAIMGPGIITANVDNDAGGIATYSLCGANFGYSLLWTLIPISLFLILVQEMCNRMGVVTGKGLSDLIREKFGVKITFYLMLGILLTNLANIVSEFAGIAASMEIFGVSKYVSVPVAVIFVWSLVVKGTYRVVEKVFLVACLFYLCYVVSGFMAKPDWSKVLKEFITPTLRFETGFLVMFVAILGTTITPWMQFYQQATVVEKGIKIQGYQYSKLDTIIGSVMVHTVAFFIIVTCGTALFQGVGSQPITTAADAAIALKPVAGNYSSALFAFGLLIASLFAATVLPLSTVYIICESFGWEEGINKTFSEAPQFYSLYTLLLVFGAGFILFPEFPLIKLMFIPHVINGLVLPFVLIFILLIINDKQIMGKYTNSLIHNIFVWALTGLSILLGLFTIIKLVV